jgi:hypothetical protein
MDVWSNMLLEYILYLIFLYILIESYVYLKGPDELKITQLNLTGNNGSRDKQRVQPEKYTTRLQPGRGQLCDKLRVPLPPQLAWMHV